MRGPQPGAECEGPDLVAMVRWVVVAAAAACAGPEVAAGLLRLHAEPAVSKVGTPPAGSCEARLPRHSVPKDSQADAIGFLDSVFEAREQTAYEIPKPEKKAIRRVAKELGKERSMSCDEEAYGEITQQSALKLFANHLVNLKEDMNLVDLGSGLGRFIVDAALFANVHHAVGVELSPTRFSESCNALSEVKQKITSHQMTNSWRMSRHESHVSFLREDILSLDNGVLGDADVVYVSSMCFRPALLAKIHEKLVQDLPAGARVVSLKAFDLPKEASPKKPRIRLSLVGNIDLPMSWSVKGYSQEVYVYEAK